MRFICPWSSTRSFCCQMNFWGFSLVRYCTAYEGVMLIWSFVHTARCVLFSFFFSCSPTPFKCININAHTHTHCKWNHNENYYLFAVSLICLCFIWAGVLFACEYVFFISSANKNEFCHWVRATTARQAKKIVSQMKQRKTHKFSFSYEFPTWND